MVALLAPPERIRPPRPPDRPRRSAAHRWRLLVVVALLSGSALILVANGSKRDPSRTTPAPGSVRLAMVDGATLIVPTRPPRRLRAFVRDNIPRTVTVKRGRAAVTYRVSRRATVRRVVRAAGTRSRTAAAAQTAVASTIATPVVAQRLRNNCEAAALEALLASVGRRVDQLELQRELPASGPRDPIRSGPSYVWGDPDRGYVGRADGGGAAGGFGVYPGPVSALARSRGVGLASLSGAAPAQVYARLLGGRAVMAWVGLADGPYESWRSPGGRPITVNLNEHSVVLTGMTPDGMVKLMNPLNGTREVWTRAQFEAMWERLGRRAVST